MYKTILNKLIKNRFTTVAAISELTKISRPTVTSYLSDDNIKRKQSIENELLAAAKIIKEERMSQLLELAI